MLSHVLQLQGFIKITLAVMIFQRLIIPSSDNIFLEQLSNDVNDVGYVDFVDETIDALLQRFPRHALVWYTAQSSITMKL